MKNAPTFFSSFLFLVPAYFSVYYNVYWHFIIVIMAVIFSASYHSDQKENLMNPDEFLSALLMLGNFYLIYLAGFPLTYNILALVFVFSAVYFYSKAKTKNYEINHSLWHLSSAIITLICVLAYGRNF